MSTEDDRSPEERAADTEKQAYQELNRAHRAQNILEDDLFKEAVQDVRDTLHRDFAKSRLEDDEIRRNARIGLDMLEKVLTNLNKHVQTGKMAQKTLSDLQTQRGFLERFR